MREYAVWLIPPENDDQTKAEVLGPFHAFNEFEAVAMAVKHVARDPALCRKVSVLLCERWTWEATR
jgi:hypothetical protein